MKNKKNQPKIAIIILNWNGWRDTIECLESIQKLSYSNFRIIVVDNGSTDDSVNKIIEWCKGKIPINTKYVKFSPELKPVRYIEYNRKEAENGGIPDEDEKIKEYPSNRKIVLIETGENLGFSGGNNVGIRYAIKNGSEAILIVNPDVRIIERETLNKLENIMFSNKDIFIVGPNIINSEGIRQSPLREPTFLEECVNPFLSVIKKKVLGKPMTYVETIKSSQPYKVEKIAGACMLIRSSFLKKIEFLDENVFLYCEEPILAARIKKNDGKIYFHPGLIVYHLHIVKGELNFNEFIKSRLYYLKKYKHYNNFKALSINLIYKIINFYKERRNR